MHRRTWSCYKHTITAENSTARGSSYIKEGVRLQIRFVEMWLGGFDKEKKKEEKRKKATNGQIGKGREIVPKTEQVRKNVKV